MGRLRDRLDKRSVDIDESHHQEPFVEQPEFIEQPPEPIQLPPEYQQQQHPLHTPQPLKPVPNEDPDPEPRPEDSTLLAAEIKKDPSPKGALKMDICGRPLDLHIIEDYLVWKTSPYTLKTIMRYHNARTMEEIKSYSKRRTRGGSMNMRTIMLIIFLIVIVGIGAFILMFMPQIMAFFKGMGGF